MLKLDVKKPRKFISPLLSKKSIAFKKLSAFQKATDTYLTELEKQRITEQSEPNIVSNALKPYLEDLSYVAQSYTQKGQSGMDLALMLEHSPSVIIEAKVFESSAMITQSDINKKALHEAILYFMRERYKGNNTLYHIIITDFYNWFVFDAKDFETLFWKNREIKKIFDSVKDPSVLGSRTEDFYSMVSEQIAGMKENLIDDKSIECAYFDLRDKRSEKETIALYKLLSKNTLQKAFNPNDANTLNRTFYSELLYILGLEEKSSGGKKLISRAKSQHAGALYENIVQKLIQYGKPTDFESVIRLMIIWINRILFLKLLESQLIKWNDSKEYAFLNAEKIKDFDRLEMLFFDILAKKPHERGHSEFDYVPYLNSSLFELHAFEQKFLTIATLQDDCLMPYYSKTVLKDAHAKRKEGDVNMLHYLFEFLDAYDFSSEGSEEVVKESKSLINASVLGLIFEKLNGYKDGSFYTPSFITMYMSKETITKAIIEKFNHVENWNCNTLYELDDKIDDKKEANDIIDSLTVCDPAVGSGHFLVSSLNTILEIKSQLRILFDAEGRRIKDYELSVENDELIVRDDEGEIFEYKRGSKEKTRIQKMLFLEKQKIIENSLFGVDINPNSAQITRLRLWIELLKNSYYAKDANLVTMPNIDINIKVGNSLISRYGLEDEIDIPNIKHAIERYKASVKEYKEGNFLSSKEDIRTAIEDVKGMFGLMLKAQWKQTESYKKELGKYVKEYGMDGLKRDMQLDALEFNYGYHGNLFEEELSSVKKKEKVKLLDKVIKAAKAIEEIEKGKVYEDAFEWRFEFPEVLDEEGSFVGFDVVIGNPPYVNFVNIPKDQREYYKEYYKVAKNKTDLYAFFVERSTEILKENGELSFIMPHTWVSTTSFEPLRNLLFEKYAINSLVNLGHGVFEDAIVSTIIFEATKNKLFKGIPVLNSEFQEITYIPQEIIFGDVEKVIRLDWNIEKQKVEDKIFRNSILLKNILKFTRGIKTSDDKRFLSFEKKNEEYKKVIRGKNIKAYEINDNKEYVWYRPDLMREKTGSLPHTKTLFEVPEKLIMQRVNSSGQLLAAYDNQQYYSLDTTNVSVYNADSDCSLKYLLVVLNSKLINWWFNDKFKMPTISGYELKQIPLKNIDINEQQPFIILADQIITLKKQNQDTSELEAQVDKMVYELYGLSEDEVALVEGEK